MSGVSMGIVQPVTEVILPHGTVSLTIDYDQGVLRIFADAEPHPRDWDGALMLADLLAGGGWDCLEDGPGVDVYEVRILSASSELAGLRLAKLAS